MKKVEKVLAFDMGGTKIASAFVEVDGSGYKLSGYKRNPTPKKQADIIDIFVELIGEYRSEYDFDRIGIAIAGQINKEGDTIIYTPNIAMARNFKLGKTIEQKTGFPVSLRNDVRCFAFGEDRFGKFKGHENAVYIAVGTGLGGAIKINGEFFFGKDNIAGEFGHMIIEVGGEQCHCGRKGCWERYVAGPGVEKLYEKAYGREKCAKDIVYNAVRGVEKDRAIMLKASYYFAVGFSNVVNVLDPEIAIIGGSMVKEKKLLRLAMPLIKKEVLPSAKKVKVFNASLGDKAFLLGAAL